MTPTLPKQKLSNPTRYRGYQPIFHLNHKYKQQQHQNDYFRVGLSLAFVAAGIYINLTMPSPLSVTPVYPRVHRIFQAILDDDSGGDVVVDRKKGIPYMDILGTRKQSSESGFTEFLTFDSNERRESLVSLGTKCLPQDMINENQEHQYQYLYNRKPISVMNPILEKYDELSKCAYREEMKGNVSAQKILLTMQLELWKFCVLGSKYASTFVNYHGLHFLDSLDNILDNNDHLKNYVVVQGSLKEDGSGYGSDSLDTLNDDDFSTSHTTSAFLSLGSDEGIDVAKSMVTVLLLARTEELHTPSSVRWLSGELYKKVQIATKKYPDKFVLLENNCNGLHVSPHLNHSNSRTISFDIGTCAMDGKSPCCQVTRANKYGKEVVLFMEHPMIETPQRKRDDESYFSTLDIESKSEDHHHLKISSAFEIFLANDCLPSYQCHVCLVRKRPEDTRPPCDACVMECKCYCQNICRIHPQTYQVTKEFILHSPKKRKDANRLIPRIVHQTYFEPLTKEKYPNFSRLVSSWESSGWEYKFYDDETSMIFLETHFAPEVREAYESILPGAYKADLFRLCVLLIHGGIYSDVDVELTSDLDSLLEDDIGFIIPIDEPGRENRQGSCLWNGMIGAQPGHPFIAKALEMIVNKIRNRFTAVDIDNMLCPGVALDHSHAWDLLYVTGPCIIGAAINVVLGRHMQSEIIPGDLNTFEAEVEIPGRSIILSQNKEDMGWHRFTWIEKNVVVAGTDCPNYDDRLDLNQKHYSDKPESMKMSLFGTKNIYKDLIPKRENIKIKI